MRFFRNTLYQGTMSDERADVVCRLLDDFTHVKDLDHIITNLTQSQIDTVKECYYNGSPIPDFDTVGTLTPAQTIGVAFMFYSQRCLIGDQVGMGKTVESAGLMNILRKECNANTLFLTEKTVVPQIRDKLIKFTGEYVDILQSAESKVVSAFIGSHPNGFTHSVVGSHSLLNCSDFLYFCSKHKIQCLIIDEGYVLKNTTSQIYKNALQLSKLVDYMIILNATPLETSARDIYNQLKLLDKSYMPTVVDFEKAFCVKKPRRVGFGFEVVGYKNCEVFRRAIKLRYLARTRDDIGAKTVDNNVSVIYVPQTDIQRDLEKRTTLYQMVADYPPGVDYRLEYSTRTTAKLKALVELILARDLVGVKLLIYSRYVECQSEMCNQLTKIGCKPTVLNGKCTSKQREDIIKDFNLGVYDVIITNISRGIDLEDCDNCILYSLDPNPQKMVQVFGRLTRDQDIMGKNLYFLISEGYEKKTFNTSSKLRATASMQFTKVGSNLVLQAIAGSN